MNTKRTTHGLSIGIERNENHYFLSLKAVGKLTHKDYEVITPMLNAALSDVKDPKVNALIDGTEMDGWEARALWDDLKLGLKHGNQFVKIAIYGNKGWQKIASKIGTWFIAGEIKFFEDREAALNWLLTK